MLQIMAKERSLSEAVAAHVLTRLDKEKERRQVMSGVKENVGSKLWRKIRNSVVVNAGPVSVQTEQEAASVVFADGLRKRK